MCALPTQQTTADKRTRERERERERGQHTRAAVLLLDCSRSVMHFKHCRRRRMFPATESANTTPHFRLRLLPSLLLLLFLSHIPLSLSVFLIFALRLPAWLVRNYLFHTRRKCSILLCVDKNYGNAASCYLFVWQLYSTMCALSVRACVCVCVCVDVFKKISCYNAEANKRQDNNRKMFASRVECGQQQQ